MNAETQPAEAASKAADGKKPSGTILETVLESLDEMKAEEIIQIDIAGKSAVADTLIVASGRSHRHVNAVSDRVIRDLKTAGHGAPKVEGMPACDWVLVDAGDVIAHIFRPEVREFYNIEKMWKQIAEGGDFDDAAARSLDT